MNHRFPKESRIRRGDDFRRVYQSRCRVSDETLIIYGRYNGLPHSRLGLSVSRKVGNAVVRNAWKRRIREAFRTMQERLPSGIDFVVIPQQTASLRYDRIVKSLEKLSRRLETKLKTRTGSQR